MNVVLTGGIGAGKSTAVKAALRLLREGCVAGLLTRFRKSRVGCRSLELAPWQGEGKTCARQRRSGTSSPGMFDVDVEVFNTYGTEILQRATAADVVVLDELGVLEQAATRFVDAVGALWCRHEKALAVIQRRALPFWRSVLAAGGPYRLLELTASNRDHMPSAIHDALSQASR